MRLKAGFGYWQTDNYPIGGCFRRADKRIGESIVRVIRRFEKSRSSYGCDMEVEFENGSRGAVNSQNVTQEPIR